MEKLKTLIVLFKAHTSIGNNIKYSLSESILTLNEFSALEAVYTKGALQTQVLAESLLIPNSSLTYVLDMLQKSEYITRVKDPTDRRRQLVELTSKGSTIFEEIYLQHYAHMRKIFDVLSEEEEVQLQELLKKIGKKAEEEVDSETCRKIGE